MGDELDEEELAIFDFRNDHLEQLKNDNQRLKNEREEVIGVLGCINDLLEMQLEKLTK